MNGGIDYRAPRLSSQTLTDKQLLRKERAWRTTPVEIVE